MSFRFLIALWIGKFARLVVQLAGQGGGTALPGLLALKVDPTFLQSGLAQLHDGLIVVSGTNGKTTTSQMVRVAIQKSNIQLLTNPEGSNLLRGIASSIIESATLKGRLSVEMGLFELDEATVPLFLEIAPPKVLVLLNLFRDQLDRYGEVDSIRKKWEVAIRHLPSGTTLILNADDPLVASLEQGRSNIVFFGIDDDSVALENPPSHLDVHTCPSCGGKLAMTHFFASHLCHYHCRSCDFQRPTPDIHATKIQIKGLDGSITKVNVKGRTLNLFLPIPGLPAVYAALATLATSHTMKLQTETVLHTLKSLPRPFGRWERIKTPGGTDVLLILIKNPAGASAVLDTLSGTKHTTILLALNDSVADGTDVSWIWDTPFERLPDAKHIIVSGSRAADLSLRLKYASKESEILGLEDALTSGVESITILATYTAMLAIRKILTGSHLGGFQE